MLCAVFTDSTPFERIYLTPVDASELNEEYFVLALLIELGMTAFHNTVCLRLVREVAKLLVCVRRRINSNRFYLK